jgi:hypothetical protein
LRISGEREGDGTGRRSQQEATAVHAGMVGLRRVYVNHASVDAQPHVPAADSARRDRMI